MSAAQQPTPSPESVALAVLKTLVEQLGTEMVSLIIDNVSSADPATAATQILSDLSELGAGIVQAVLIVIEPAAAKAAVAATYAAVEATADAAEDARFPKG